MSISSPIADRRLMVVIATAVVLLDQATKALCVASIPLHARRPIVDGYFALTYVRNRGMAFGLFNGLDAEWVRWALAALAIAAVAIIWTYARQERSNTAVMIAFGAILGGALGNLIDRVRLGYVVDFLLAHWGAYEWPAFNVADSAITMGGVALFLALATERDTPDEVPADPSDDEPAADAADGSEILPDAER
jgi:signal peptidase II